MTDERDTLIGDALRALPVPDHGPAFWAEVEAALPATGTRKRFRGTALQLAAGFVALVLVVAGIVFLRGRGDGSQDVSTEPEPAVVPSDGAPPTFVGIVAGRLATFSSETGKQLALVGMEPYRGTGDVSEPRVAGNDLVFVRNHACDGGFVRVDLSKMEADAVIGVAGAKVSNLAVSPNAAMVAYVRGGCPAGGLTPYQEAALVVRNMATGEERSISMGNPPTVYGPPSWAPDGRHLALMARGGGGVAYGVNVIDTSDATSIEDAEYSPKGDYCYQENPEFLDDGSLVVLTCGAPNGIDSVAAIRFDAQGNQLGKLFDLIGDFDAGLYVDQVTSFSLTPDGKHAIYQVQDTHSHVTTYRWDGDAVRELQTDAREIAW